MKIRPKIHCEVYQQPAREMRLAGAQLTVCIQRDCCQPTGRKVQRAKYVLANFQNLDKLSILYTVQVFQDQNLVRNRTLVFFICKSYHDSPFKSHATSIIFLYGLYRMVKWITCSYQMRSFYLIFDLHVFFLTLTKIVIVCINNQATSLQQWKIDSIAPPRKIHFRLSKARKLYLSSQQG